MTPHIIRKCLPAVRAGTLCFALCTCAVVSAGDTVSAQVVSKAQFDALSRIPIVIFYGDNIPARPVRLPAQDS